ncbi:hypothetical protein D3C86_2180160 [compost metagenome]
MPIELPNVPNCVFGMLNSIAFVVSFKLTIDDAFKFAPEPAIPAQPQPPFGSVWL